MISYNNKTKMYTETLIKEYKKCPCCSRRTNGIEDFYSLIDGSESIKKSCQKCRLNTYKSYKKNNPEKFKGRVKRKQDNIDYTQEYKDHKRCPQCNRKTMGENDYKHFKNNKTVKTCKLCRIGVINSYKKRPKPKTQKQRLQELENIINKIEEKSNENENENTE